jgi:Ca2+-binding RTX toxin-like protein
MVEAMAVRRLRRRLGVGLAAFVLALPAPAVFATSGVEDSDLVGVVVGAPQADVSEGKCGDDTLYGLGNDHLNGGPDVDSISGGPGNDVFLGGGSGDEMDAGTGHDVVDGGAGDDRIDVRDRERDVVRCAASAIR